MVDTPHTLPAFGLRAFNCPHCGAFAKQEWLTITTVAVKGFMGNHVVSSDGWHKALTSWAFSECEHCHEVGVWHDEVLDFPASLPVGPPHPDMPEDVVADYEEARRIVLASPRAAAALLRLALQRLMPHLGANTGSLNEDIGHLVKNGLPAEVQQALDTLRVVGNNAVHPGEIDLRDDPTVAHALFDLLNFVVQDRISRPRSISGLFSSLPAAARKAVERRDS